MTGRDVSKLFVKSSDPISEVLASIDRSGRISVALVVDECNRLINTVTDGDIRRAILAGLSLDQPVSKVFDIKARTPHPKPVTALAHADRVTLLRTLKEHSVRQLPLVNALGVVVDIVILSDFQESVSQPFRAVVMAGGQGSRLRPLTENTPKPMLPVGGRPVLEHIVEQLRDEGITRIHVTTHYHADKIMRHFGGGESFGVDIQYVNEDVPLGTGGALGLLAPPDETVLVINGDILTHVDFRAMHNFHQDQQADMTIGVRRYDMQVPYGVVECDGVNICALKEKPQLSFFVNAGVYLLEPSVFRLIPANQHLNITDLVSPLVAAGRTVVSYPICEYWLDIGRLDDYRQAQEDVLTGKLQPHSVEAYTQSAAK
jgi:dTDP-glucose pyrophosphorylase/CBS domain-containing protein